MISPFPVKWGPTLLLLSVTGFFLNQAPVSSCHTSLMIVTCLNQHLVLIDRILGNKLHFPSAVPSVSSYSHPWWWLLCSWSPGWISSLACWFCVPVSGPPKCFWSLVRTFLPDPVYLALSGRQVEALCWGPSWLQQSCWCSHPSGLSFMGKWQTRPLHIQSYLVPVSNENTGCCGTRGKVENRTYWKKHKDFT